MSTNNVHAFTTLFFTWDSINWKTVQDKVQLLQNRIVKAAKQRKFRKVKSLQWILTRSFYAKLLAIRKVTLNKGKNTAGVDAQKWKTEKQKWDAVKSLKVKGYKAKPLKRIFIPKSNGKKRPLAIPTMKDRAMQALFLLAMDPVHEVTTDSNSYGFRKRRSVHDAIERCFMVLASKNRAKWVLEADIKQCFDEISHQWLLKNVHMEKRVLKQWLKAGIVYNKVLHKSKRGTPQGSIISPLLANIALDELETELKMVVYPRLDGKGYTKRNNQKINMVRYADDFIITASTLECLETVVKPFLEKFLAKRGLSLSEQKTKTSNIDQGFDFLGHNLRKFQGKLIIKPNDKAVRNFKRKVFQIINNSKADRMDILIDKLNPVIRGWAYFYRSSCAKQVFTQMDHEIYTTLWKWAKRRHNNKPKQWIKDRYFIRVNGRDWVFAYRQKDKIFQIFRMETVKIIRHTIVRNNANVYDKQWQIYFQKRRQKQLGKSTKR